MHIDILIGLLIGWGVAAAAGEPALWLALLGALAAVAPDADFIVWLARHHWKTDQFVHEHRDLLHHPFLVSVIGGLGIALIYPLLGLVWCLATLWHFIHDTFDGGWGIRWGSPWSGRSYMLTGDRSLRSISSREEQYMLAAEHGNPQWSDEYLRPDKRKIMIYIFLIVLVAAVIWYLAH